MSTKNLARVAGLCYLIVAVAGGFAESVRRSATVAGDAAATAANVQAHQALFRVAFAADLLDLPFFLAVGAIMYVILKPVSAPVAMGMLVLNAVSVAVQALNMLGHAGALLVATDPQFTAGLSTATSQAIVLFLLDMHRIGYLVAQIFFGLYLLPLGYLVYRSGLFPKALGWVLMAGAAGYAMGVGISFAAAGFDSGVATYFGLAGGLAEMVFLLWLLIFGVNQAAARPASLGAKGWAA